MKNGEEVVSVGGAVDQSNKNVGTSASTSIILDLVKVIFHHICHVIMSDLLYQNNLQGDRVWLQLLRGNLVETANRKTGYSTFTGIEIDCLTCILHTYLQVIDWDVEYLMINQVTYLECLLKILL